MRCCGGPVGCTRRRGPSPARSPCSRARISPACPREPSARRYGSPRSQGPGRRGGSRRGSVRGGAVPARGRGPDRGRQSGAIARSSAGDLLPRRAGGCVTAAARLRQGLVADEADPVPGLTAVAGRAGDSGVCPVERPGRARVVEAGGLQGVRGVAPLAGGGCARHLELPAMGVAVARLAGDGGPRKAEPPPGRPRLDLLVALDAGRLRVAPGQREARLPVIECRPPPALSAVAALAAALLYPTIQLALVDVAMARRAAYGGEPEARAAPRRPRRDPDPRRSDLLGGGGGVARVAGDGEMATGQWIGRLLVLVEPVAGGHEARHVVTGLARAPAGARDELTEVGVALAGGAALVPQRPGEAGAMAAVTGDARVTALERVSRAAVVEARPLDPLPPPARVTARAGQIGRA